MNWYEYLVLIVYLIALGSLFFYSLGQLHLTIKYLRAPASDASPPPEIKQYPKVTIQLPVYNEKYVIGRLIDSVCQITYPKSVLEIQVLDDSDDETVALAKEKVSYYQNMGFDISHIQRPDRKNFKAGALAYGLERAKGEYLAIFDADFMPSSRFLQETIPYFNNKEIGMVQTRWGHINRNYSFFTRMQAFGLYAHFSVEQTG